MITETPTGLSPVLRAIAVSLLALLVAQGAEGQFFRDVEWIRTGHWRHLGAMKFLPDGNLALTESDRITIYDRRYRSLRVKMEPDGNPAIDALDVLPSGDEVIAGGTDLTVWNVVEGGRVRDLPKLSPDPIWALAASADGRYVAVGQGNAVHGQVSTITLYDLPQGRVIGTMPFEGELIGTLLFTPSGDTLVSSDRNGWTYLWDVERRVALDSTFRTENLFGAAALSPDGRLLVTVGDHRLVDSVEMFDLRQGLRRAHATFGFELFASSKPALFRFSPDGRYLAVGLDGSAVSIRETERWTEVSRLNVARKLQTMEFAPDGGDLLVSTSTPRVEVQIWPKEKWSRQGSVWDHSAGELLTPCDPDCLPVVVSPDGKYVVTHGTWIHTFDAATGAMTGTFKAPGRGISLCFTADSRSLVVFGRREVTIWPVEGFFPDPISMRPEPWAWGSEATYSPDGRFFAGSSGGDARLWNATVDTVLRVFADTVSGEITFSPDSRRVAWGTKGSTVRIWSVETGELEGDLPRRHEGAIASAQYAPNGERIATTGLDGRIVVWDVERREAAWERRRGAKMRALRFSPDGAYLYVGGDDSLVVVYDARTGDSVDVYDAYREMIDWIDISPDGRRLVVGGWYMLVSYRTRQGWVAGVEGEKAAQRSGSQSATLGARVPNPSRRGEVVIPFTLSRPMHVRLVVIDARGNEVGLVVQGSLRAGPHRAVFSTGNLPAGTYFYALETDDGRVALPMVVE